MKINGVDVSTLNAIFLGYEFQSSMSNNSVKLDNAINPIWVESAEGFKQMTIVLKIKSTSKALVDKAFSTILSEFADKVVISEFNGANTFTGAINKYTKTYINDTVITLEIVLNGVEEGILQTKTFTAFNSGSIVYNGTTKALCSIEITSSVDDTGIEITGLTDTKITFNSLTADTTRTIDAEEGTILEGTTNKFSDTVLYEFPSLKQGTNTITCNKSTVTLVVKYKERYL